MLSGCPVQPDNTDTAIRITAVFASMERLLPVYAKGDTTCGPALPLTAPVVLAVAMCRIHGQHVLTQWSLCQCRTRLEQLRVKDRKSTRLNSSHVKISYAVFC